LNAGLDKSELDTDTKYLPMNVWAWKARGVVRFVSIISLLSGVILYHNHFKTALQRLPSGHSRFSSLPSG
jgi:hypothetical protein